MSKLTDNRYKKEVLPRIFDPNGIEREKLNCIIAQTEALYDISSWINDTNKRKFLMECKICLETSHYTENCPTIKNRKRMRSIKGIPKSLLTEVSSDHKGAMLGEDGKFFCYSVDIEGYHEGKKEIPPFLPNKKTSKYDINKQEDVPEYLLCKLCNQLIHDASITQCCQKTFCYKCITDALLSSPNNKCPICKAVNISAVDMVFPNRNTKQMVQTYVRSEKNKNNKIPSYYRRYYSNSSCMYEDRGIYKKNIRNRFKMHKSYKSDFNRRNFKLNLKCNKRNKSNIKVSYWKEWLQYLTAVDQSNALNYQYNNNIIENLTLKLKSKKTEDDCKKIKRSDECKALIPFVRSDSKRKEMSSRVCKNNKKEKVTYKKNSNSININSKARSRMTRYKYDYKTFQKKNLYTNGITIRKNKDRSKNNHDL